MSVERSDLSEQRALSFGHVAESYQAARPTYPDAAIDWLVPERTRRVLDLGAGTGKFTESLVARGLDVIAVEPSVEMLQKLAERLPTVDARQGTAESIPVEDASVDVVTVAQAWHWVDADAAVPEIARILRTAGLLSLVWNMHDDRIAWVREMEEVLGKLPRFNVEYETPQIGELFGHVESWTTSWTRKLTLPELDTYLRSLSYVSLKSPPEQAEIVDRVQAIASDAVAADGTLELPYLTECHRARLTD
ncbi:class I SAM-dependent methyltransferase [Paramicrobacterium agarici]|uniref:Methyltransferase family protein n=1 Tax=Paramicrobacterium agarici TaxID=630514 RepID=A0A2A9DY52_9MICO|nr:class I SAM-dependent methyltransferase [Microbacterium agarici]PFG31737.1 methyltransferase family protein [Microbacterium agarici]